jgi:uncharacterized membrane protein YkvA (DUF1232 family)/GTP-binding protein EngB required for normal cell division
MNQHTEGEPNTDMLVMGFVGTVSTGKSTAILKLFDIDVGSIDPLPGSTTSAKFFPHPELENMLVADLPGLGDINADLSGIAKKAMEDELDLIVNIVNADGGIGELELANFRLIQESEKPFLVCLNKIDLIPEDEREELRQNTCRQLSLSDEEVIFTAFHPDEGEMIGVDKLNLWVIDTLEEEGKRLLYLKGLKKKAPFEFEEEGFWEKIRKIAGKVPLVPDAVALYYCMLDHETSITTKIAIAGALAYLVWPGDMIPEAILGLAGYVDDAAAIAAVGGFIQEEHRKQAADFLNGETE